MREKQRKAGSLTALEQKERKFATKHKFIYNKNIYIYILLISQLSKYLALARGYIGMEVFQIKIS